MKALTFKTAITVYIFDIYDCVQIHYTLLSRIKILLKKVQERCYRVVDRLKSGNYGNLT